MTEPAIPDELRNAAVDALYAARDSGLMMDAAAEAVVAAVLARLPGPGDTDENRPNIPGMVESMTNYAKERRDEARTALWPTRDWQDMIFMLERLAGVVSAPAAQPDYDPPQDFIGRGQFEEPTVTDIPGLIKGPTRVRPAAQPANDEAKPCRPCYGSGLLVSAQGHYVRCPVCGGSGTAQDTPEDQ